MKPMSWLTLADIKKRGEKIVALTAYDASFCHVLNEACIEVLLVGDSLGMVIQGHRDTLKVTTKTIAYHTRCVARANTQALLMADMPFMSASTCDRALRDAEVLIRAGAQMVKLEGGARLAPIISELTTSGIAVCAHIGLAMQYASEQGGVRVQGRDEKQAKQIEEDALTLEQAGAKLLILECVPRTLAARITRKLRIPVIGIGAGPACDGQILVTYDLLGLTPSMSLRFTKNFLAETRGSIRDAFQAYHRAVKSGVFPTQAHCFEAL